MRRFLVFLEPVEILDLAPEVRLIVLVLLLLVSLSVGVVEGVRAEDHAIAVLNDGLAGDKDVESAVKGIMDAQLMTV